MCDMYPTTTPYNCSLFVLAESGPFKITIQDALDKVKEFGSPILILILEHSVILKNLTTHIGFTKRCGVFYK